MNFYNWLITNKNISAYTAKRYVAVIEKRINEWLPSYEIPRNIIDFEAIFELISSLDIYNQRNKVGNQMYSSAFKKYKEYLEELSEYHIESPDDDSESSNLNASEYESLVKIRLSQNKFRKALFEIMSSCAVTGFKNSKLLIASHIKPWANCNDLERIDPYNGFLLTPNFDRLFDQGLITFLESGSIKISKKLDNNEIQALNIPQTIKIKINSANVKYLNFHQENIFLD